MEPILQLAEHVADDLQDHMAHLTDALGRLDTAVFAEDTDDPLNPAAVVEARLHSIIHEHLELAIRELRQIRTEASEKADGVER